MLFSIWLVETIMRRVEALKALTANTRPIANSMPGSSIVFAVTLNANQPHCNQIAAAARAP